MTPVASLALAQDHFNEMGKMKSLIRKKKSAHRPKALPHVTAAAASGCSLGSSSRIRGWKLTPDPCSWSGTHRIE